MTRQSPPDPPPPDASGEESESKFEKELDEVLARAAALAEDLSKEVGVPPGSKARLVDRYALVTGEPTTKNVESTLTELDKLVASASTEVAGERKPSPTDPSGATPAPAAANYAVPDFMSEFTQPEDPTGKNPSRVIQAGPPPAPPAAARAIIGSRPGVIGSPAASGLARGSSPELSSAARTPGWARGARGGAGTEGTDDRTEPRHASAFLQRMLLLGARGAVTLLELADRPFRSLSSGSRRFLGWLALATIGVSLILLAQSFVGWP